MPAWHRFLYTELGSGRSQLRLFTLLPSWVVCVICHGGVSWWGGAWFGIGWFCWAVTGKSIKITLIALMSSSQAGFLSWGLSWLTRDKQRSSGVLKEALQGPPFHRGMQRSWFLLQGALSWSTVGPPLREKRCTISRQNNTASGPLRLFNPLRPAVETLLFGFYPELWKEESMKVWGLNMTIQNKRWLWVCPMNPLVTHTPSIPAHLLTVWTAHCGSN